MHEDLLVARCSAVLVALFFAATVAAAPPTWSTAARSDGSHVPRRTDAAGVHATAAVLDVTRRDDAGSNAVPHAPPAWAALGPYGGSVADVAYWPTDPQVVLAAAAEPGFGFGGLYRSTDAAATWTRVPGLGTVAVIDIEFNGTGKAWIATRDGVWDSTNGGATWTPRNLGIGPDDVVMDVTLDPSNPLVVWAAVNDVQGFQPNNVMKSIDGGVTWANRTPPLASPMSARAIAVDPTNSNNVVAVFGGDFGGGQTWITNDGGTLWTNRSAGIPANPMRAAVHLGSRILVAGGQLFGGQGVGLYASTNQGVTWTPLHNGTWPSLAIEDVFIDAAIPSTIWVVSGGNGVYRSVDGGTTWQIGVGGTGQVAGRSLRRRPGSATTFVLGTDGVGVMRSIDSGATFAAANTGIAELNVPAVAASPLDSARLAAAFEGSNSGGVYTSSDGGASWTVETAPPTRYSAIKFAADGTLFALSSGPSSVAPEGVYVRQANGNWLGLGPDQGPLYETDLASLHADSADGLIVAGGSDFGVAGFDGGIWRRPPGSTWERAYQSTTDNFVEDIEVVADGGGRVFAASWTLYSGTQDGGVLRSSNEGGQWLPAVNGLPTSGLRDGRLCRLPGSPETLVHAVTVSGLTRMFRSTDAALSWQPTGFTDTAGLSPDTGCDPSGAGSVLLARSQATPVLRSPNGGTTFDAYDTGLGIGTLYPRRFAFTNDPTRPTRALLATSKGAYGIDLNPPLFSDSFENP